MAKGGTKMLLIGGAVIVILVAFVFGRDILLRSSSEIQCDDGLRRRIDSREFSTQYWAYAVELEGSIADKGKISGKLEPKQLLELSESMQSAKDFQKFVVSGFNACAITKQQYASYGARFQALDGLSRQINMLSAKPSLDPGERTQLRKLVDEYSASTRGLAAATK